MFALLNKPVINGPPPSSKESVDKSDDTAGSDVKQVLVEKLFTMLKPEEKTTVDKKEPDPKANEKKKEEEAKAKTSKQDVDNAEKPKPEVSDAVKAKPADEVKKEEKRESNASDEKDKKEVKKEPKEGFERGLLEFNSSKLSFLSFFNGSGNVFQEHRIIPARIV